MSPTVPVPSEQKRRFDAALCQRIGVDPAIVSRVEAEWGGPRLATITVTLHLPEAEVMHMYNTGEVPS